MEETFTDYNTFFGHYLDDYLIIDKLILKIKAGINQLVMKILNQDCKNIVIVEKKGIKLFHHTFNKLISNGFTIASIRFLKIGDEIFFIKNLKPEAKEIVLCTDAINKGKELSNIISHFNKSNIIVKHVYSYFANPNGIKNITKSTQIKENQISYHELFDFNKLRDISNQ